MSDCLKFVLMESEKITAFFKMDDDKFDVCYGKALFPAM